MRSSCCIEFPSLNGNDFFVLDYTTMRPREPVEKIESTDMFLMSHESKSTMSVIQPSLPNPATLGFAGVHA